MDRNIFGRPFIGLNGPGEAESHWGALGTHEKSKYLLHWPAGNCVAINALEDVIQHDLQAEDINSTRIIVARLLIRQYFQTL